MDNLLIRAHRIAARYFTPHTGEYAVFVIAIVAAQSETLEEAAAVVENWHISRGGYLSMAEAIREMKIK